LLDLGEQEAALERGEQSYGEVVRVDAGREAPGSLSLPKLSLMAADHCWKPAAIRVRACGSVSASWPASERCRDPTPTCSSFEQFAADHAAAFS
jgi:hypothetical protein